MRYLLSLTLFACVAFAQTTAPSHSTPKKAAPKTAAAPVEEFPTDPGLYAAFNTNMGRIVCKLYEKESPITVANFVGLARGTKAWTDSKTHATMHKPYYNGLTFHRVIPDFMIQAGDREGTGAGNPGIPTIKDEHDNGLQFDQKGRLAMANTGAPHSSAAQFFITDSLQPRLNGGYTIFGQVVEGQDIVTKIAAVPRETGTGTQPDRPFTAVVIERLTIKRVGPAPAAAPKTAVKTAPNK